jgi:hypothetical protein
MDNHIDFKKIENLYRNRHMDDKTKLIVIKMLEH